MTNGSNNLNDEMDKPAVQAPHSAFNERWDLSTKHQSSTQTATTTMEASHSILDSLRKKRGLETAQWLNGLSNEISLDTQVSAANPVAQTNSVPRTANLQSADNIMQEDMIKWVDKIFDQFEIYATQFNHTAQGTDLIVSISRPSMEGKEQQHFLYDEPDSEDKVIVPTYEGHLTTRFWAMPLRGMPGKVEVFVIPVEVLLAFATHRLDESAYSPLLVLECNCQDGKVLWHIAQTNVTVDQISMLTKELFGDLIRVSSGQMSESELFAHPMQELTLGENLAVGYKMPAQPSDQLPSTQAATSVLAPPSQNKTAESSDNSTQTNPKQQSLNSLTVADQLLTVVDQDINQLFGLGKTALESENTATFKKVRELTEKMESFKEAIKQALANLRQASEAISKD